MVEKIETDGIIMQYAKFGEGSRNFVVIPGLSIKPVTENETSLAQAFRLFVKDFTVYVFDRRENPPEGYSVNMMAEDTVTVLKKLGVETACFFGASQGGMITLLIAMNYPDMTEKIIVGSSASRKSNLSDETVGKWIELAAKGDKLELFRNTTQMIYSERIAKSFIKLFPDGIEMTDEELSKFVIMASACKDFDIYDRLEKITCPALIIGAEGDKVLGGQPSRDMAEKIPDSTLYMYGEKYSHGVYDEAPDYRKRIFDFITTEEK